MAVDYIELGERIRYMRDKKGLSQEKLAELAGLSPSYLSEIETGKKSVSLTKLVDIANILESGLDMLLCASLTAVNDPFYSVLIEKSQMYTKDEIHLSRRVTDTLLSTYRELKVKLEEEYKDKL